MRGGGTYVVKSSGWVGRGLREGAAGMMLTLDAPWLIMSTCTPRAVRTWKTTARTFDDSSTLAISVTIDLEGLMAMSEISERSSMTPRKPCSSQGWHLER